jgi:hypothetical protein
VSGTEGVGVVEPDFRPEVACKYVCMHVCLWSLTVGPSLPASMHVCGARRSLCVFMHACKAHHECVCAFEPDGSMV